jgi:hypothetical protein
LKKRQYSIFTIKRYQSERFISYMNSGSSSILMYFTIRQEQKANS